MIKLMKKVLTIIAALTLLACSKTEPVYEQQDEIFQKFVERYPNLQCIARHVRYAHSGSENSLKAFMWYEGHTFESKLFTFNILDRVGGGDAFASGLIYAMIHNYKPMECMPTCQSRSRCANRCPITPTRSRPMCSASCRARSW